MSRTEARTTDAGWPPGTSRGRALWPLLVVTAACVVYLPSLANGFTLDDVATIQQDARLRSRDALWELVAQPYVTNVPPERSPYRPVTTLSYLVDWRIGDGSPVPFHVFNELAHMASTLLVFGVAVKLGARRETAGLAALLFAVHPVHVEAVANIVGRGDVLMTLGCLVAVWLYLATGLSPWIRGAAICLAYLFAVGAKENGYVLPLLIVLVELVRTGRAHEPWRARMSSLLRTWPLHAALAVTLIAYLLVRRSVLGGVVHLDVAAYMAALPTHLRLSTAVANLTEVARLLLVPADLSWHYGPAVILPAGPASFRFWLGIATCLAVGGLAVASARGGEPGRWTLLAIGWVAASFLLVSNLVVPMPMWLAERTLYLPSVGVVFLGVGVLSLLDRRIDARGRAAVLALVGLLVLAGGARSWGYARVWRNNDTLMAELVERHPESFRAPWWTGQKLVDAGEVERGLVWLEQAVELNPNEVTITLDYARALLLVRRSAEAEALLRPIPRGLHPSVSVFLAQSLLYQDRRDEAREVVEEGLRLFPNDERLQEQRRVLRGR